MRLPRASGEILALDLRSLAVFRVAIGGSLLLDLLTRTPDLVAHYTERGALPVPIARAVIGNELALSIFSYASGSAVAVGVLFALAAAAALALALGWRTRAAAALSWFLLVSLQVRNPLTAAMGGDKFLRIVLLWSLLLPLGARWSLDARRRQVAAADRPTHVRSVASAAFVLQICLMYWITGLRKSGPAWLDGSAVHYALYLDVWATAFGQRLRELDALIPLFTYGTRAFEILGPCLVFVPFAFGPVRTLTIAAFALFHLSLAVALNIGWFPLFTMIAWPALLPSWFFDRLLPAVAGGRGPGRAPRFEAIRTSPGVQAIAAALGLYVIAFVGCELGTTLLGRPVALPAATLARIGDVLRVNQRWAMFAPEPPRFETWPVFRGTLADGRVVDPWHGGAPPSEKPALLSASFPRRRSIA